MRGFEKSPALLRETRTQTLRTSQAYDKIASSDRNWAKKVCGNKQSLSMYWGAAGTGVGARIGGHNRRGGTRDGLGTVLTLPFLTPVLFLSFPATQETSFPRSMPAATRPASTRPTSK